MKRISPATAQLMKGNNVLIGRLMAHFNKSQLTINRMIDARNVKLSTGIPLSIIREELAMSDEEILEVEPEGAQA